MLIIIAFAIILSMAWTVRALLAVLMGAIVLAVLLRTVSRPLRKHAGLGSKASTWLAIILIATTMGALAWLFGMETGDQVAHIGTALPEAWRELRVRLLDWPMGSPVLDAIESSLNAAALPRRVIGLVGNIFTTCVLMVFGGVFIGLEPDLYVRGLLALVPRSQRALATQALDESGQALRKWLEGQLLSMAVVAILTGLGLWLAGVPFALALGLIAGLTEGIPYLGPIIGAIPGVLLALVAGPDKALWALAIYAAVQQIEGNTLVPLIQRRMVALPPALTLFSIVAAGLLLGPIGLVLAAPMTVVAYTLVRRLYVREVLAHDPSPTPPAPAPKAARERTS
nr:AI-2E family transporter [Novosphingobium profundi]